ncbi:N-formylglutamate amidohydrolase [Rhizobium setariae]|uniref:N-formylglutamate amidohydrolase n=1 Tax=Rhizobium setariae TaxID=2801340 RepID=UPI003CCF8D38
MWDFTEGNLFDIWEPEALQVPVVLNSPHSGRIYPRCFVENSRLDATSLRRSEDHYVEQLFFSGVELGAPMLSANFPRAYVDVNREPYELDPRMFVGTLPPFANTASIRVAGGLGTVPRIVAENMEIYRQKLPVDEALCRVEQIYKPYHAALRRLLARTHTAFGRAVLLDCHSMPGNIRLSGSGIRPDFIIGDRYGTSASAEMSRLALKLLEDMGFAAVRNKPYAGGFITEHYGRPARGLHALQIEINRALYIDEATLKKKSDFANVADAIRQFLENFAAEVNVGVENVAFAAE